MQLLMAKPTSTSRTTDHQWVYRMTIHHENGSRSRGYIVRPSNAPGYSRWFDDSTWGGKQKAYRKAVRFANKYIPLLPRPFPPKVWH